jgi:hypothetical protein
VDAPVPELWPSALQDRPDGNCPLRMRLGLGMTRPVWERAQSPVRPQSLENMGHRRTVRRAVAPRAYGFWREVLFDLRQAERTLASIEEAGPDPERQRLLVAIRTAREQLETFL